MRNFYFYCCCFFLLLAISKLQKATKNVDADVDVDADAAVASSRQRIWEISRKSYENWLAKVAEYKSVCVCQIVQIYALYIYIYIHTHLYTSVCVWQKLSWSRVESSVADIKTLQGFQK